MPQLYRVVQRSSSSRGILCFFNQLLDFGVAPREFAKSSLEFRRDDELSHSSASSSISRRSSAITSEAVCGFN
jgi:hypothetical protein